MKSTALCLAIVWGSVRIVAADEKGAAAPQAAQAPDKLTAEETRLIEATNAERSKLKLPPLKVDPVLLKIAREHSANMARLDKLGHELEGQTFVQRMEKAKYQALRAGENVAQGQRSPDEAVAGWMQSPGHKANILQAEYTHIGVGLATSKSGQAYYTQVFAQPFLAAQKAE
jgi:uncharacterized protein YkwD